MLQRLWALTHGGLVTTLESCDSPIHDVEESVYMCYSYKTCNQ